jgi:predicted N-acetyltransferase YhbS
MRALDITSIEPPVADAVGFGASGHRGSRDLEALAVTPRAGVTMNVEIRSATSSDAGVLSGIAYRAKASGGYPREWMERWRTELTLSPEYLDRHRGFVAVVQSRPVGVCVLEDAGGHWNVEHLWVEPGWQRRGVGRRLLRHILEVAARLGSGPCEVVSDPHAESFYSRHGARRIRTIPAPMPGAPDRVLPVLCFDDTGKTAPAGSEGIG